VRKQGRNTGLLNELALQVDASNFVNDACRRRAKPEKQLILARHHGAAGIAPAFQPSRRVKGAQIDVANQRSRVLQD